jgi:hypothetical protein
MKKSVLNGFFHVCMSSPHKAASQSDRDRRTEQQCLSLDRLGITLSEIEGLEERDFCPKAQSHRGPIRYRRNDSTALWGLSCFLSTLCFGLQNFSQMASSVPATPEDRGSSILRLPPLFILTYHPTNAPARSGAEKRVWFFPAH